MPDIGVSMRCEDAFAGELIVQTQIQPPITLGEYQLYLVDGSYSLKITFCAQNCEGYVLMTFDDFGMAHGIVVLGQYVRSFQINTISVMLFRAVFDQLQARYRKV